jgi:hypothetical protein
MSNGITVPKDGGGIKWSTLKRKVRKMTLANGDTVDLGPVFSEPFGIGTRFVFVGYEVELEREVTVGGKKVSKIQVWVLVTDPAPPNGRVDPKGWCHGTTFDDKLYSPAGSEVPAILAAGWEEIDCANLKKGDIIVYSDPAGTVVHSAVANGDGTFTSKEGNMPEKPAQTKAAMDTTYKAPPGTTKCYRKAS